MFIDDIEVSTGEGTTSFEDDGDPMDGWTVPGAPQDDAGIEGPNRNDWVRRGGLGIKEGAAVATPRHALHGLRLRGHQRRRDPQRDHGSRDRLPARLAVDPSPARLAVGSPYSKLSKASVVRVAGRHAQRDALRAPTRLSGQSDVKHGVHAALGK